MKKALQVLAVVVAMILPDFSPAGDIRPSWAGTPEKTKKTEGGVKASADSAAAQKKPISEKEWAFLRKATRYAGLSVAYLTKQLSLNSDQVKKMASIDATYRRNRVRSDAAIRYAQIEIIELFYPAKSNPEKIESKLKEYSVLLDSLQFDAVQKLHDSRSFLNDSQFNKYKNLVDERIFR